MNAKPSSDDIAWMRNAFRDILRIRTSTPLFHLRSAADVRQRLAFRNTGPKQNPLVIVGHLDGGGMVGPYREVLYLLNVSPNAQRVSLPEDARKAWVLHPVQASLEAPDTRPKQARHDSGTGSFRVPGRTVVVYVLENGVTR